MKKEQVSGDVAYKYSELKNKEDIIKTIVAYPFIQIPSESPTLLHTSTVLRLVCL